MNWFNKPVLSRAEGLTTSGVIKKPLILSLSMDGPHLEAVAKGKSDLRSQIRGSTSLS